MTEEAVRRVANYPEYGMEEVYLGVMGIADNAAEIERQRMIFLREVSEEIALLRHSNVLK